MIALRRELVEKFFDKVYTEIRVIPSLAKWKVVTTGEYWRVYGECARDLYKFWELEARKLKWTTQWSAIAEGEPPSTRWFIGGRITVYHNVIGKHRGTAVWSKVAVLWEGGEGVARAITYGELDELVSRIASALSSHGVKPGDWIIVYSPPLVEAIASMLAAVKVGAPFEPVFVGLGPWELAKRIRRRKPRIIFASDSFYQHGEVVDTLSRIRRAVEYSKYSGLVVIYERLGAPSLRSNEVPFQGFIASASSNVEDYVAESTHPLFGLHIAYRDEYKPITHPTGGFLVQTYATTRWIGLRPLDTYFCTIWPGLITGVSYLVFGPLMIGSTLVVHEEGLGHYPWDKWLSTMEDYAVTVLLTTGVALKELSKRGEDSVKHHDVDTLKMILAAESPLEAKVSRWVSRVLGGNNDRLPVLNLYIQSEVGTFVTGNLLNYVSPPVAPGSSGPPIPGFIVKVLGEDSNVVDEGFGEIVLAAPWPSMPIEYPEEYAEKWRGGVYRTGDYGYISRDHYLYIISRVDGVLKVNDYRVSPGAVAGFLKETLGVEFTVASCLDEEGLSKLVLVYEEAISPSTVKSAVSQYIGESSSILLVVKVRKELFEELSAKLQNTLLSCNAVELQATST